MATYLIESNSEYKKLVSEFEINNGRKPNDLDKMTLMEQLKFDSILSIRSQLDRIEIAVCQVLSNQHTK